MNVLQASTSTAICSFVAVTDADNERHHSSMSVVDTKGHTHQPGCGHDLVEHDDHYDYIGDDGMLHHLLENPDCCEHHAARGPLVVSHGRFNQIRRRTGSSVPSLLKHDRCVGRPACTLSCCTASIENDNEISNSIPPTKSEETVSGEYRLTRVYCAGICCPMEVPVAQAAVGQLPGVDSVEVAVVTNTVTVKHIPSLSSPASIVAALNEAQLDASLTFPRQQTGGVRSWIPPLPVLVAAGLLIISLIHYLAGPTGVAWLDEFKWVALGAVALPLPGIVLKALGALRHGVLDIHFLIVLAASGAIALGDYTEAATVVVLFAVADFLESRCTGQARDAIAAVLALKPDTAVLASTGAVIPAAEVTVGTLVLVRPGDKASVDGIVVTGCSSVDESVLSGESVPIAKSPGDEVKAGTLNAGSGLLEVRATVAAEKTFVAEMARLVEQATSRQSPSEAAVAKFAKIYTPLVVLACVLLAFVPWADPDADRKSSVYLALEVLVIACPCALVLSTPVTVVSALARAAQVGVLIKGGLVLETLQNVDVVSFDKTGTLTKGVFLISEVAVHRGMTETTVLQLVGSLERGSSHPLAAAIVGRAAARGVACNASVQRCQVVPGFGIRGVVNGHTVCAGSAKFIEEACQDDISAEGEAARALDDDKARFEGGGLTTCHVALDGKYVACIAARDTVRKEAPDAVDTLHGMGMTCAILTGDNTEVALAVATAVGVDAVHVHAQLLPEDKLETVAVYKLPPPPPPSDTASPAIWGRAAAAAGRARSLLFPRRVSSWKAKQRRVAHVGDGVNDAPALAAADVGIAMGVAGAAAALEAGDVALFTNDLSVVPALCRLSKAAGRKIIFNIALSVITKVAVLIFASLNMFTLWGAVLVDVGTALLVTLNGLTLLRWDFGLGEDTPTVCVGAAAAKKSKDTASCCKEGVCCGEIKKVNHTEELTSKSNEMQLELGPCVALHDISSLGGRGSRTTFAGSTACCDAGAEASISCGNSHNHDHHHHHTHYSHSPNHVHAGEDHHSHHSQHHHQGNGCCVGHTHKS